MKLNFLWSWNNALLSLPLGDQVRVMSVTPTPYGAGFRNPPVPTSTPQPSFVCLLSSPDSDSQTLNDIQTGRHVLRLSSGGTLSLPEGTFSRTNGISILASYLPYDGQSQGVFYCEASNRGRTTRVPVSIFLFYSKSPVVHISQICSLLIIIVKFCKNIFYRFDYKHFFCSPSIRNGIISLHLWWWFQLP